MQSSWEETSSGVINEADRGAVLIFGQNDTPTVWIGDANPPKQGSVQSQ